MAPSSSKVADNLLESAHDSAVHDGLRLAVPRYLEAIDALVEESRADEATKVLAELLAAKEKRRGFFLGKREQSALGDQRTAVASKYAQLIRGAAPTEDSLDLLNQLALEYPDDFDVRVANAEALRQAGYLLDALDEYKYCKSLQSGDVDLDVKLGEVYCQLGRADDAVTQARQSIAAYAASGNDGAAAALALRLLDFAPNAFEESFDGFASLSADALIKHRGDFDAVAAAFGRADLGDPARRAVIADKLELVRRRVDGKLETGPAVLDGKLKPAHAASEAEVETAPAVSAAPRAERAVLPAPSAESAQVPTPAKRPSAAGGLSAFAKRKALELFANSEYEAAIVQLERVVKMSPDVESLEMLLECNLALERHDEAARVGVRLADAEVAAGNRQRAIATLTALSKKIANPTVEQRRVELMQSK